MSHNGVVLGTTGRCPGLYMLQPFRLICTLPINSSYYFQTRKLDLVRESFLLLFFLFQPPSHSKVIRFVDLVLRLRLDQIRVRLLP